MNIGVANLIGYFSYFGTDLGLLIAAGFIYVKLTPLDEIQEILYGNVAAAIALAGAMIGYGLVVYSANTHAQGILETAIWSGIALVSQIIAMEILRLVLAFFHDDWKKQIAAGDVAHGVFAGAFSLTVGILNAACVT